MANFSLSNGSLKAIMEGATITDPIMQVLESKKVTSKTDSERYRIHLSDGKHSILFALLTTQTGVVENNTIIKLKKYVISDLNNANTTTRKILLILDMEVVAGGSAVGCKLGDPQILTADGQSKPNSAHQTTTEETSRFTFSNTRSKPANNAMNQSISDSKMIFPITALTPYHNKWTIKGRIINKGNMRTWSNSRGEGKLFSCDLIDETGEIRMTAFQDLAEKYYNYLQEDKIYFITKCTLKEANKKFNNLKNDYEMTVTSETIIEECHESDEMVPQIKYNFVSIGDLASKDVGDLVDVIGICKDASDLQVFTSRSNKELKKREVNLIDPSKSAITLTLWGSQAETFNGNNNPVLVVKGAKVGEFGGGKNISLMMSSIMKVNPDMPECHKIRGWYDIEGRTTELKNMSERTGTSNFNTPWMPLKEVYSSNLGLSEKGDYYQFMGTILLIRSENAIYKACPTADCHKKIVDQQNGMYRCEKCNKEYPNFKYRLLMNMNVGDWSANQWMTVFTNEAEKILGKTSQEIGLLLENEPDEATNIFQKANFQKYVLKCRAKMETYNDEERLKTVVVKADPVNYEDHNNYLVDSIQKYLSVLTS